MKDNLSSMRHIIGLIVQILFLCYFGDSKKVRHRKGDQKETYTNVVIKGRSGKAYYEDDPHIKIITDRQQIAVSTWNILLRYYYYLYFYSFALPTLLLSFRIIKVELVLLRLFSIDRYRKRFNYLLNQHTRVSFKETKHLIS